MWGHTNMLEVVLLGVYAALLGTCSELAAYLAMVCHHALLDVVVGLAGLLN